MTVKDIIEEWKSDSSWIEDTCNPFLKKNASLLVACPSILFFSIEENTHYCDQKVIPFYDTLTIPTSSNDPLNLSGTEADRIKDLITQFTKESKEKRKKELDDLVAKGKNVLTTNIFGL